MKWYTIHKGKHRSGLYVKPHYNKHELTYDVTFTDTCRYTLNTTDQFDINKLFGLSYGFHHHNSVRFGWRNLKESSNKIEILAYCYIDGIRLRERGTNIFIGFVDTNKTYTFSIKTTNKSYILSVDDKYSKVNTKEIDHNKLPKWGYHLYPYFGGNCPAPHDINIFMEKIG